MSTQFNYEPFSLAENYETYDIIRGVSDSDSYFLYATQNSSGQHPNSIYSFFATSWTRKDNKTTLYFTKTGTGPNFAKGSLVNISSANTANYTGMIINAGSNFVEYINRGITSGSNAGIISCSINPCWTSGFMFVPSYQGSLDIVGRKIEAKFGDGYSQRQRDGLNSNNFTYRLGFENRTDKEVRAISNFLEDKGGVDSFELLLPVNKIINDSKLKFIADNPRIVYNSYNMNTISADFMRVFDL
jgi:phage-related protein